MVLTDKVAIITGGASGIGAEIVRIFIEHGAKVLVADLNQEGADKIAAQYGEQAKGHAADVSNSDSVKAMVDMAVEHFGTLDVIVNNAGVSFAKGLLEDDIFDNFQSVTNINQFGVLHGSVYCAKKLIELDKPGVIINMSSIYAQMAAEMTFSYNVSKAAVTMMTKSAALELAPYNIRVVGVAPGRVNTPMLQQAKELGLWDKMRNEQMRREFTEPEEIANVVAFLASDASNCINGTVVSAEDGYLNFKSLVD